MSWTRTVWLLLAAASLGHGAWEDCRSGPFQVWTDGNERPARELLVRLEQVRHVLGVWLGKEDLSSVWPMHILMAKGRDMKPQDWVLGRETWLSVVDGKAGPSRDWQAFIVKNLIESNSRRMPVRWENGLIDFLSTLDADGPKITLGVPPPPAERTLDWARIHFFATNLEYQNRFRVLLNNIQQGSDEEVAYKNSLGRSKADFEAEIAKYFAAGQFDSVPFSGKAINERDFYMREIEDDRRTAALDDLRNNGQLPADLAAHIAKGTTSARIWVEHGKRLTAFKEKQDAFVQAAKLNPRWAQPYIQLANLEKTPARQAFYLKTASSLEPRNSEMWQRLARAQSEANELSDASKSWFAAELATHDLTAREAIRQSRLKFEEERAEREAAEKKRIADERQRELDRLREQALNSVREAEARANKGNPLDPNTKVEQWWDDKVPLQKLSGVMQKVDCYGKRARIWVAPPAGKPVALWIPDSSQVVILGGGEAAFGCGVQKPARQVTVEYAPRADAKQGTAGDVRMIEFR